MSRLSHVRLTRLARGMRVGEPPLGRLLLLIPDLWPEDDRALFADPPSLEVLGDLVERRTGVRPTFAMLPFWAITVPAAVDLLALSDDEKAAFLEAHEARPIAPGRWDWRGDAADDATQTR